MNEEKAALIRRLNIIQGQVNGIINMLEEDRYCIDISNQLLATIAALKSVNKEVLSQHLHHCVKSSIESENEEEIDKKLEEINEIIGKLSKS